VGGLGTVDGLMNHSRKLRKEIHLEAHEKKNRNNLGPKKPPFFDFSNILRCYE